MEFVVSRKIWIVFSDINKTVCLVAEMQIVFGFLKIKKRINKHLKTTFIIIVLH